MQRKKGKSSKKTRACKRQIIKQINCSPCSMALGLSVHVQQALYRKYSCYHISQYVQIQEELKKPASKPQEARQYLQKYFKPLQRKHQFYRVKEIYKLHKDTPRLFMPKIIDILAKCHHRKRLLDYFKIAKILGLKVQSAKTSTFIYSLSKTYRPGYARYSFENILGQISEYQFSEYIQKQLIQSLQLSKATMHKKKAKQTANHQRLPLNPQYISTNKMRPLEVHSK